MVLLSFGAVKAMGEKNFLNNTLMESGGTQLLPHQYPYVEQLARDVNEGRKSFYERYLLNPSLQLDDIRFTAFVLIFLLILRFIISGAHHPRVRHFPSLFRLVCTRYSKPKKESKLCENLWYSLWHTFSFCFGIYVLILEGMTADKPGWVRLLIREMDVKWYWFPTPVEHSLGNAGWPLFPITAIMKTYYLTEMAFWVSCAIFLALETIRDDFYALMVHHTATCTLILFSYICSFWRIGTVILVTHDLADIILYTAKAFHYTRAPSKVVDFLFFLFVVGFFVSRLIFFPLFCVRPALDTSTFNLSAGGVIKSHWQVPGGITLPFALCVLQMLHIFWFGLIIKMIMRTLAGKNASQTGDIRSDDEDEDSVEDVDDEMDESNENEKTKRYELDSSASSTEEVDQRMKLSSLPGVRATLTKRELRSPRRPHISDATEAEILISSRPTIAKGRRGRVRKED